VSDILRDRIAVGLCFRCDPEAQVTQGSDVDEAEYGTAYFHIRWKMTRILESYVIIIY
jgi:hypothetical protein